MDFVTKVRGKSKPENEWTLEWAIDSASALGVLPSDAYLQTVDELNTFLEHRNLHEIENIITQAWRTINFLGGFFSGKLSNLDKYLPETPKRVQEKEEKTEAMLNGLDKLGFKQR